MTTTDVRRQARAAGIRGDILDLAAVERRRGQLWLVTTTVLVLVASGVGASALWPQLADEMVVSPRVLQLAMPAVAIGFAVYSLEKERALRRLTRAVLDDLVAQRRLALQAHRLRSALEAGSRLHAGLGVDHVLEGVLDGALELVGSETGALLLDDGQGLAVSSLRGDGRALCADHEVLSSVAETGTPLRVPNSGADDLVVVPLSPPDGVLLGVLAVTVDGEAADDDLGVLSCFGEFSATAIANAIRFHEERADADRLRALEAVRQEFSWLRHETGVGT